MGIAFVLLGLLAAAIAADYVAENLNGAGDQTFALFGGSFTASTVEVVLAAAVLGALAVSFVVIGMGLVRGSRGRRRAMRRQIDALERENAELRSRSHVVTPVRGEPREVVEVEGTTVDRREETPAESRT